MDEGDCAFCFEGFGVYAVFSGDLVGGNAGVGRWWTGEERRVKGIKKWGLTFH
ncbi:MAG: hypothetical protein WC455_23740 [Dehalococcoidia bacterium]